MTPPMRPGPAAPAIPSRAAKPHWAWTHGLVNDHVECLDVRPSRHFRHHSSESGVLFELRQDHMCEYGAWLKYHDARRRNSRGFITGRLDAEHRASSFSFTDELVALTTGDLIPPFPGTLPPSTRYGKRSSKCPASPQPDSPSWKYIRATVLVGHERA